MKKILILCLFLLSISVAPVHAYYVDVEWEGLLYSKVSVTYQNQIVDFNAGLYKLNFWDAYNGHLLFTNVGFCVEPGVSADDGTGYLSPVSDPYMKQAAWLMSKQWDSSSLDPYKHTGLQLAIWDALNAGVTIRDKDTLNNPINAYPFYTSYISKLPANLSTFSANDFQVVRIEGKNKEGQVVNLQDMLIYNPVPEPATIMLLGIGLLGISAAGRKKRT